MKHSNHKGPPKGSRNAAKPPESHKAAFLRIRITEVQASALARLAASQGLTVSALVRSRLPEIG